MQIWHSTLRLKVLLILLLTTSTSRQFRSLTVVRKRGCLMDDTIFVLAATSNLTLVRLAEFGHAHVSASKRFF